MAYVLVVQSLSVYLSTVFTSSCLQCMRLVVYSECVQLSTVMLQVVYSVCIQLSTVYSSSCQMCMRLFVYSVCIQYQLSTVYVSSCIQCKRLVVYSVLVQLSTVYMSSCLQCMICLLTCFPSKSIAYICIVFSLNRCYFPYFSVTETCFSCLVTPLSLDTLIIRTPFYAKLRIKKR